MEMQNIFIVISSYLFYGWWDWRFLILIFLSTLLDFIVGLGLARQDKTRQDKTRQDKTIILLFSIFVNITILGFFKYFNFFVDNFAEAFRLLGFELNPIHLKIILPVGISFYTFQTMSYSIDVYRGELKPTKNFIAFAAFVSFFPQLVAGPIERAKNLLPQFLIKRTFDYTKSIAGCKQILWGFFKKIVIADNCAIYANMIFDNSAGYSGSTLLLGAFFFAFQIYGDFSGYSDIAIGISKLFGINLMNNFKYPYFSRDIAEFWRRWHISLTTWFRDYIYIPLGGSRNGIWISIRNTFIVFVASGFWHGAKWTFIVWGFIHALYFLPLLLLNKNRININSITIEHFFPNIYDFMSIITTFFITCLGWIFFRAETLGHAFSYIRGIFSPTLFSIPVFDGRMRALITILLIICFVVIEWFGRSNSFAIEKIFFRSHKFFRWVFYYVLIFVIIICYIYTVPQDFIYFQF
jgi:D-alanyl-lipoteichoic acid acyltransferase DltB (MBOAT superfamily)